MIKTFVFLAGDKPPFALTGQAAANLARDGLPDIAGYIQTRAIDGSAFSGCAELYFWSGCAADEVLTSALKPLLTEGTTVVSSMSGHHRTVMRLPQFSNSSRIKGVYPFHRRPDMAPREFQSYWWRNHGPIAAQTENALAYYQTHPLLTSYEEGNPDFDGVTEIYWADKNTADAAVVSRQMTEDQAGDAQNFVDLERVMLFFGVEDLVIAA